MYGPCLRRHPVQPHVRCVDIAGHTGDHMAHGSRGILITWADDMTTNSDGLRELAAREAGTHPDYYGGGDNPYEAIKVIEAWDLNFNLGNVIKYVCRAGKKDKDTLLGDLEKARDYLDFEIERRERVGGGAPSRPPREREE